LALATVLLPAGARSEDVGTKTITFRVVSDPASAADVEGAVSVMRDRIELLGVSGVSVKAGGQRDCISVSLTPEAAPRADSIVRLAMRRGTLALRLRAKPDDEAKWRGILRDSDGLVIPPLELSWFERARGGEPLLVLTPERRLLRELEKLRMRQLVADAPEVVKARAAMEQIRRSDVFTHFDLGKVEARRQAPANGWVVHFELKPERREAFARFLEPHLREELVIIFDDKVESTLAIAAPLPGAGVIASDGGVGYSRDEAHEIAIALTAVPLRGRLERIPESDKK